MKIERISENQIKVFLNQSDLRERNIKLTELAYGSEKTQALFREMMEKAVETCGFEVEDSPLMIEAAPIASDGIVIIVSKVLDESHMDNKFTLMPPSKEERKFKRSDIKKEFFGEEYGIRGDDDSNIIIYSFDKIDDISAAAHKANKFFSGTNILYRYNDKYFLVIQNDNGEDAVETDSLDLIFSEYGYKHTSNVISKYFLAEHGEIIIKENVINIFASYM